MFDLINTDQSTVWSLHAIAVNLTETECFIQKIKIQTDSPKPSIHTHICMKLVINAIPKTIEWLNDLHF